VSTARTAVVEEEAGLPVSSIECEAQLRRRDLPSRPESQPQPHAPKHRRQDHLLKSQLRSQINEIPITRSNERRIMEHGA